MATVAEAVKESILGVTQPEDLSPTSRTTFLKFAKQDEEDGDYYMGEDEFINAIAPPEEDYVRTDCIHSQSIYPTRHQTAGR